MASRGKLGVGGIHLTAGGDPNDAEEVPEGLPFVSIFTQTNIVRRSRRDAVASVLSGQRFFIQSAQNPGYIRYDEKRAEKAIRNMVGRRLTYRRPDETPHA